MKRALIAALCVLPLAAVAEDKMMKPAGTQEPGSQMTCGQMMEAKSALPAKMSELMAAIADGVESHAKWAGATKEGKAEQKAMDKIGKDHRQASTMFKKMSEEMAKNKAMPGVAHDMTKMDPKAGELMTRQIALTREMANMMLKDADETEKMMKAMAKGPSGM